MDPTFTQNNPAADGNNNYQGPYQSSNSPYNNDSPFDYNNFDNSYGNGNLNPTNYQQFNATPWQHPSTQSPAPARPPSASNGMQYGSPYSHPQGLKYVTPASYHSPNISESQQGSLQYGVPVDPALTYNTGSLPPNITSNVSGASNFPSLARPTSTVSPLALEHRPPAYKNPYPQGTSMNGMQQVPPSQTNQMLTNQPQPNQSQTIYSRLNYPQGTYPQLARSPVTHPQASRSPISQPQATQPYGNALMEAVVINQPQGPPLGPPSKTEADVPTLPPSTVNGRLRAIDANVLEGATKSKGLTSFLTVSNDAYWLEPVKSAIPKYAERRSKRDLEQLFKEGRYSGSNAFLFAKRIVDLSKGKIASIPGRKKKEKVTGSNSLRRASKISSSGSNDSPRATTGSVPVSSSGSDSDSASEYDSDSDDELSMDEPSPLPANRPEDPVAGAKYDTTKVVWSPRNRTPTAQQIRAAVMAYSELMKEIRNAWKASTIKLKEESEKTQEASALRRWKTMVNQKRQLMETALKSTLENGHPAIIEKLGEHPLTMAVLYTFLVDRHNEGDGDGSLTVQILKTTSHFLTMDEEMLEKTKNTKVLSKLAKTGSEDVKSLVRKVFNNATAATKAKTDSSKPKSDNKPSPVPSSTNSSDGKTEGMTAEGRPSATVAKTIGALKRGPETIAGAKRPRENDAGDLPVQKRAVVPSNTKPAPTDLPRSKPVVKKIPAPNLEGRATASTNLASAPIKPKTSVMAAKPPAVNVFASLSSASKKPGTSNAALAAAAKQKPTSVKDNKPVPIRETRASSPPPRSHFSLSETLASLNEPKKPKKKMEVDERPPETEEQRARRIRKEARRHLRVSFKPDDSLTEIHLFTHDPDEEISAGDRAMQGAGDLRGEGQALKRHMDHDMDEEEVRDGEQIFEWKAPTDIDFGDVDEGERKKSFSRRGGLVEPKSPHKKAEEERQATTLMVFYTSLADIPPSPREPSADDFEPADPEIPFGEPSEQFRAREARINAARNPQPQPAQQIPPNVAELLARLNAQKTQQQQGPQIPAQQPQQNPFSHLERTFGMFSQQQPQAQPPTGATPAFDLSALLAQGNQYNQPQVQPTVQPQNPGQVNLQEIIARIQQQQGQQPASFSQNYGQPPPAAGFPQNYGFQNQQAAQTSSYGQNAGYGNHNGKKRRSGDRDEDSNKRSKGKSDRHPLTGTIVCRYWKEGNCYKGTDCSYRHYE